MAKKSVRGKKFSSDNLFYHYLQYCVLNDGQPNNDFERQLLETIIRDLSVWFPREWYAQQPVLLPYVVRDSSCKSKTAYCWGEVNTEGYFKDDNSLIKDYARSLKVTGNACKCYEGQKLERGFTACHIWINENQSTTADPQINSFIGNLVWLPKWLANLSDHNGSYVQEMLKVISYKLYKDVIPEVAINIDEIWAKLPESHIKLINKIDTSKLNFFDPYKMLQRKRERLDKEIDSIIAAIDGGQLIMPKVKCDRYLTTLVKWAQQNESKVADFKKWLISNNS